MQWAQATGVDVYVCTVVEKGNNTKAFHLTYASAYQNQTENNRSAMFISLSLFS